MKIRKPLFRPNLVQLESRDVPATIITILDSGAGTLDGFLSATDGTIAATDNAGVAGSVSRAALQGVNATTNISITAETSIVVNNLTSTLALLTGAGNTATFTASAGSLTFTDTNDSITTAGGGITLTATTVAALGRLSSSGGNITVTATNGNLTVLDGSGVDVDASFGSLFLTAGSVSNDNAVIISAGAQIVGAGGIILTADNLSLGAGSVVNSGAGTTTLRPFEAGTLIDLGGADAANTLGITQTEINTVVAGVLVVGRASAGDLTVSTAITRSSGGQQLELVTGGAIIDGNAAGDDLTALRLALTAGTGVATSGNPLEIAVSNLEGATNSGGFFIANTGTLSIGGVNATLLGVQVTAGGDIVLNNSGSIQALTAGDILRSANGNVTVAATGATADVTIATGNSPAVQAAGAGSTVSITAGRDLFLGVAAQADVTATNVTLSAGRDIILRADSDVSAAGGSINVTAGRHVSLIQTGGVGSSITTTGPVINITTGAAGIFTLDSGAGGLVTTTNQPINITADDVVIVAPAAITAGSGLVTIKQVTGTRNIDLGTNTAGQLGLTDAELDLITSSRLVIGATVNTGNINVTAPISRAGVATLSLLSGGTISNTGAGSLAVTNLRASALNDVILDAATNEIGTLAGGVTAAGGDFIFRDATGFAIGTVDGVAGITTSTGANSQITLTAGGAVSQTAGANLIGLQLELLGTGSFTLNNTGNDVVTIAANLTAIATGTLTYTDANNLTIGTAGTTNGVTTNNASITINTVDGNLTVSNTNAGADANAGTNTVSLTAGSVGAADRLLDIQANAAITGTGGVTLIADNMSIAAPVNAGANTAILRPFQAGTLVSLGVADAANTLGLTDAELDLIAAATLLIGAGNTGTVSVQNDITRPASTNLQLISGAGIVQQSGNGSINANGGTLLVTPATNYLPQRNGVDVTASTTSFANGSDLLINITGATVDTQYTQLNVAGTVNLTGVDLVLSGAFNPLGGTVFTIVSATSRTGTFNGLPEGATLVFGSTTFQVQYTATAVRLLVTGSPPTGGPLLAVGGPNQTASLFVPNAGGTYGSPAATLAPFGAVAGSVRTATADVNNDGTEDTILVTGPGTPIRFAVVSGLNNTTLLIPPTAPFAGSEDFLGGGFVSATDLDGDGRAEIVITPDQGGGPRVTIFSLVGTTPTVRVNFFGIDDPNFRGGARSALGDVNKDGKPDLLVAAGFGGGPRVSLFEGTTLFTTRTKLRNDFFAFPEDAATLRNGIFAALGDISGDGFADLIFGGGPGGAPRVFILSGALHTSNSPNLFSQPVANFFVAGNANDRGGVRLAAKNADGDAKADLAVGSGEGSPANVRVYLGKNFTGGGEPSAFQDISVFGGVALTDGVFVG